MSIPLNCDLGEIVSDDLGVSVDAAVMPYIDQASIACGFHAGNPLQLSRALDLAKIHGVTVGAHPSYADREGFGRRTMDCSSDEIIALMHYQMAAIEGMATSKGLCLEYVKPHGALYNDMMSVSRVREAIMQAVSTYHRPVTLMLQATPDFHKHSDEGVQRGIKLWFEAFVDRCYDDVGKLLPRSEEGAVHNRVKMMAQLEQICRSGSVTTVSGNVIKLHIDTLCVHGDNREAVSAIKTIRNFLDKIDVTNDS